MKSIRFLLVGLGVYALYLFSKRGAPEVSQLIAPSAPSDRPLTSAEAQELADAYSGFPASTPLVYADGDVTRETTAGQFVEDVRAAGLMLDDRFLPSSEASPRLAPGTDARYLI